MKKIGDLYCIGGQTDGATTERITLFDGRFDTGFKVVEFRVTPGNVAGNEDAYGKLVTDTSEGLGGGHVWNWGANVEIAWAQWHTTAGGGVFNVDSYIDPDHMVIEDLYFHSGTGATSTNYQIILQKYEFTDWFGALNMVRNNAQNVSGN